MRKLFILLFLLISFAFLWQTATPFIEERFGSTPNQETESVKILREENLVVDVVKNTSPSVVTIGVQIDPNALTEEDPLSLFFGIPEASEEEEAETEEFIGSGFVISKDGLIATNKHVVSDGDVSYVVIDNNGEKYEVSNIYRDPLNDFAILKTNRTPAGKFKEITLGDSSNLQVGQFVIAIGTALGEFTNTVTTGVVSGLGRGITAGSAFEGFAERLDDVIQTDAAISPGNSGGPLLNSKGAVIGINTAVARGGQNIGFAIPINIVKESLKNFNETGQFNRPYLGVSYIMLSQRAAELNDLPEGAYVQEVVPESAAEKAGIQAEDVITKIDGKVLTSENGGLAAAVSQKKIGDSVDLEIFRNGETLTRSATLLKTP